MAARPFRCPPEFVAADPAPPPELCGAALGGGGTELWLIRAPAAFRPESLQGCSVPLDGCGWLRPPGDPDGDGRPYRVRGAPDCAGGPLLLTPQSPGGALACAPPLRGCLAITESCGGGPEPPDTGTEVTRKRRKKKKKKEEGEEQPPEEEGGGSPGPPQTPGDPQGPEPPRRKKKKRHKHGRDDADPVPAQ